jgi:heme exporter protein D
MYFDSLQTLLIMDGHGVYVWTAYLVTITVLVAALLAPRHRRKRFLQQLAAELKRTKGAPGASTREQH